MLGDAQLNREDLLTWLVDHGALAGPVPGIAQGEGWQELTDMHGVTRWVWNSPGVATTQLPPGMRRGSASGAGMRCLMHSLSQMLRQVKPDEPAAASTDALADWHLRHLPLANEARDELMRGVDVDVWSVLPVFTTMFGVRVQVFRYVDQSAGKEYPGYPTILPSYLVGSEADEHGNPTPILHLYWDYRELGPHFEPVWPVVRPEAPRPEAAAGPQPASDRRGVAGPARPPAGPGRHRGCGYPRSIKCLRGRRRYPPGGPGNGRRSGRASPRASHPNSPTRQPARCGM